VVALTYRVTVDVPARFRNSKAIGAVFVTISMATRWPVATISGVMFGQNSPLSDQA
jgi:hypothetical protein